MEKTFFHPSGRKSLIQSFFFVIIFTPFSVERYIKFLNMEMFAI